jgi:hypothetical protein
MYLVKGFGNQNQGIPDSSVPAVRIIVDHLWRATVNSKSVNRFSGDRGAAPIFDCRFFRSDRRALL